MQRGCLSVENTNGSLLEALLIIHSYIFPSWRRSGRGSSTDVERAGLIPIVAFEGAPGCAHDGAAPSSGGGRPRGGGGGVDAAARLLAPCQGTSIGQRGWRRGGVRRRGGDMGATAPAAVPADVIVEAGGGGGVAGGGGAGGGDGNASRRWQGG